MPLRGSIKDFSLWCIYIYIYCCGLVTLDAFRLHCKSCDGDMQSLSYLYNPILKLSTSAITKLIPSYMVLIIICKNKLTGQVVDLQWLYLVVCHLC